MIPAFKDPYIDPRRWAPHGEWATEGREEADDRMPAFARDFFGRLFAEFPPLAGDAVFLRWSVQPDDIYAFFDGSPGFAVQIDPHLEYIVVVANSGTGEYGDWGDNDRVRDAPDHVRSLVGRIT